MIPWGSAGSRGGATVLCCACAAFCVASAFFINAASHLRLADAFAASLPSRDWGRNERQTAWVLVVDVRQWLPYLAEATRLLDARELERVQRMRRDDDARVLTMSYALHRLLLGHSLQVSPPLVRVSRDHLGCPRLAGESHGTSLSHSSPWIALAVRENGVVGVDIEPRDRSVGMDELAASICHPDELALLSLDAAAERAKSLLRLWVRKEALLKALGVGLSEGGMSSFSAPAGKDPFVDRSGECLELTMLEGSPAWLGSVACAPAVMVQSWVLPAAP